MSGQPLPKSHVTSVSQRPAWPLARPELVQVSVYAAAVLLLHVVGWGVTLLVVAPRYPFMLGFAGLAYSFGLRHAFDADHIAAIDNTTRKLMNGESRPLGVGFFFSLGHSTVVFVMTLAVALAAHLVTVATAAAARDRLVDRHDGVGAVPLRDRVDEPGAAGGRLARVHAPFAATSSTRGRSSCSSARRAG